MKKIMLMVFGLSLCVFVYSDTYSLESVDNSSVGINGTDYNCSSTSYGDSLPTDLGIVSYFDLDARCRVNENSAAKLSEPFNINSTPELNKTTDIDGTSVYYSFDKSSWTQVALIRADQSIVINNTRRTAYSKDDIAVDLSGVSNGDSATIYLYYRATEGGTVKTDPVTDPTVNPYEATFLRTADIYFEDGSAYNPGGATKGNTSEIIGKFYMDSDISGATLTDISIDLEGTRSGFSNLKLWASTDGTLDGGDTQLGSTIVVDPGANPAVFSSFSSSITTAGVNYFLAADVDEEATGGIRGYIAETADMTIVDGLIDGGISNAPLSSSEIPTSICLVSFDVTVNNGKVDLSWTTESETENSHFLIYRDGEVIAQIQGAGTTTEQHSYTYVDTRVQSGVHSYVLADVSYDGIEAKQAPVAIEIESNEIEANFVLNNAYPNPFNPSVTFNFQLSTLNKVRAFIYNTNGEMIKELLNEEVNAGSHTLTWNAEGRPSGVYIVKMIVGNTIQSQKLVLMK